MPLKSLPLLAFLCAVCAVAASAQEPRRITLEGKDGVPAPAEETDSAGTVRIKQVPTPALEIYPTATRPARGTIMIAPGGGYNVLAIFYEGRDVAKMLNEAGWDAAVLLYPVSAGPDTRTLALDAAGQAFTLLQKRGGEFGLSTAHVGAMGFSAGGHLTARLAHETAAHGTAPAFLVLMYPAYLEKGGRVLDDVAPIRVPVFLYVGEKDKTYRPSSEAYAAACKEKGIRCEYGVAPDVGHGFGLKQPLAAGARDWPDKLKAFLAPLGEPGPKAATP